MPELKMVTARTSQKRNGNTISISKNLADQCNIKDNQQISINVAGKRGDYAVKVVQNKHQDSIFLPAGNLRRHYLASGRKYGAIINEQEIRLGPVVGIMAEVYGETGKPFGAQSFFIRQLISSGRKLGQICFAFSPYGINWKNRTISGYTIGNGGWVKNIFPLPDVIYPRERAYSSSSRRIRNRLESMGTKLINPSLIGKWQTYKILSKNPYLVPYIPDTRLITSFRQIEGMVKKYQAVYLKPVNGSQGRNIVKVAKKRGHAGYDYQYVVNNKVYKGSASNLQQLRRYLSRIMGNRTYIVQKQINLIRSRGSILDVRILVQKDNSGQWGITGMAGRVGRKGAITSNISSGGQGRKVRGVLKQNFHDDDRVDKIIEQIKKIALESAQTMEETIGKAGEMGIDIGVDRNGEVWFIEANLRPARRVFTLIGERKTRIKSVITPLLYARHLANFE